MERTGSIAPRPRGKPKGSGKLEPYRDFLIARALEKPDVAIPVRDASAGQCTVRKVGHTDLHCGLRCGELTAPWIIEGAMNRAAFEIYIETQLAPTLKPRDVVPLDNLSVHHRPRGADILAERGAWFLFLPKYSPDLIPIVMAFSTLKAHLRGAAARNFNGLSNAIGDICSLLSPGECWNFFKAANYVAE